jgi:UDP-N-acetylmuramoyl-L-alanyl-D-glutamate--2,6-diaminopimelate ligase
MGESMAGRVQALESVAPDVPAVSIPMSFGPRPLRELLAALSAAEVVGDLGAPVAGVTHRSAEVRPGWLFFCVPGAKVDGHAFADRAVAAGAVALVAERRVGGQPGVAQVLVPSVREAMGTVAAAFYGSPSEAMVVVGITGTAGKTTSTYLLERVFHAAGMIPGVIGTTGVRVDGSKEAYDRTTPEAPDLQRYLAEMRRRGVGAVAMEVSSHGLHQRRVGGIRFDCAVFTNLSQDHLDYHGSMEEYFETKARLFTPDMADRAAVNHDSAEGRRLAAAPIPVLTYGLDPGADVRGGEVHVGPEGIRFRVGETEIRSRLLGAANVSNCLAVLAAARQVGIADDLAVRGIAALPAVPGRMEAVDAGQPFRVVVDYAHKPGSLENALRSARSLAGEHRVISVIGCGGDRDRGKRAVMGEVSTRLAEVTVLTSDNPRSEEPMAIIGEMEPGAEAGGGSYHVEGDRRAAIRLAMKEARPGDVVVIAGKGDETGQEYADRTIPFDDRVVAREELDALGAVR